MSGPRGRPQPPEGLRPKGPPARGPSEGGGTSTRQPATALHLRVRGRLRAWASAGAGTEVLTWLKAGYRLPWARERPRPFHQGLSCKNATPEQRAFLATELQRLKDVGAVEDAVTTRWVSRAFLVPKPKGWRLVVDLRHINTHLRRLSCRFETLKNLARTVAKGDYMFSFDLKDGFYAVGVAEEDRDYLTFHVDGFGPLRFSALPMGLSSSPYVFTKTMRTLVRALRSPLAPLAVDTPQRLSRGRPPRRETHRPAVERLLSGAPACAELLSLWGAHSAVMATGVKVLPYVDDFLGACGGTKEESERGQAYAHAVVDLLGLERNAPKDVNPCQQLKHLGLGVDTARGLFYVTQDRLDKLRAAGREVLSRAARNKGLVPVRQLAGFAGLAQSLYLAIPCAKLYLRSVHDAVASAGGRWSNLVRLSSTTKTDINFFVDLPAKWNGRDIWRSPQTALLHCDASELAWGGVLNQRLPARGFWRAHQLREHITLLELRAVEYSVEAFASQLRGRHITLREDNQAVVAMLKSWTSRSPAIMRVLRRLHWRLDVMNSALHPGYIRSGDNWWADALSRAEDSGDYRLNPSVFGRLQRTWQRCTIDRFATANNTQLRRFNSAWACPGSCGVDAFAQEDWGSEINYCNPPWELLDRLAQHLRESGSAATVVAPYWPAQSWFHELNLLASEVLVLPPAHDLFCPGRLGSFEPIGPPRWPVACFRIVGRGHGTTS
jgi:hypothetical protein